MYCMYLFNMTKRILERDGMKGSPFICVDTYIYSPPLYKIHASTEIGRHEACEIAANYNQKLSETKKSMYCRA